MEKISALRLAIRAKRAGAIFAYSDNGRIVVDDLAKLPPRLLSQVVDRLGDIIAVVSENSIPVDKMASDAVDAARAIVLDIVKSRGGWA
jgi:hypothetical protein